MNGPFSLVSTPIAAIECPSERHNSSLERNLGETHFYALVVSKKNTTKDQTEKYLEKLTEKEREDMPEGVLEQLRFSSTQKGLLEMGVFKEDKPTGREILTESNVDSAKLFEWLT